MTTDKYIEIIRGLYGEKFEKFKDLLLDYNNKFNLTAITDENGIYIKHFLDSLMGESLLPVGSEVIEIGSGGGFPSIPLKIIREDLRFTLVESTGKKCEYLKAVVDKLEFDCVKVINARAEELGKDKNYREKYDFAVARAVARMNSLVEYCLPFVKVGGKFIAYKGDCDDELKQAERAIEVLGGKIEAVEKYLLPDDGKRTLAVIKKVAPTPPKYPRGQGKERKNPIC